MPRSSPFTITLSSAEEAESRRPAGKYTLPYFQVQRAKMILYAAEGMPNDEIAACLDTRREVVSVWRKRFCLSAAARYGAGCMRTRFGRGITAAGPSRLLDR